MGIDNTTRRWDCEERAFTVHGLVWGCLCLSGLGMAFISKLWVSECLLCRLLAKLTQPPYRCLAALLQRREGLWWSVCALVPPADRGSPGAVRQFSPEVL